CANYGSPYWYFDVW
nr:immunoglobulin heavy chain junction region [Mus musculus]